MAWRHPGSIWTAPTAPTLSAPAYPGWIVRSDDYLPGIRVAVGVAVAHPAGVELFLVFGVGQTATVAVAVAVAVAVSVAVAVGVSVAVAVAVAVCVGVSVGVSVGGTVGVLVGGTVFVGELVGVADGRLDAAAYATR
jgi:hypothetical protein